MIEDLDQQIIIIRRVFDDIYVHQYIYEVDNGHFATSFRSLDIAINYATEILSGLRFSAKKRGTSMSKNETFTFSSRSFS